MGPVSALYGANAFGGVINIISKKGGDINGLQAEQGFGSFNTSFEKVSLGLKKAGLEFSVAGTLYSSNGPVFNNRDPQYNDSYVDKAHSINAIVSYEKGKTKTTIGYRTYRTPMGYGTYSNSPTVYLGLPAQGYGNSGVVGLVQRNFNGEKPGLDDAYLRTFFVQEEYKASAKLSMMGRFVYRETGTAEDSYAYVTIDGKILYRVPVASYSNRVSGEYTINYEPLKNNHITGGIQYYQDNVETGSRAYKADNTSYVVDGRDTVVNLNATFLPRQFNIRNNFGSYVQYVLNTKLLRKTNFTAGARYDNNSYFGNEFSPRFAIVNQPTDQLTFKFQYGKAFRAPTNLEIYQTPAGSNFQLKEEKIHTYEFNVIYAFSSQFRVQLNGYRNELRDVIVLGNLNGLNPDKNPGLLNINGVEAVADVVFNKNLSAFMNFTYQDATGENLITHTKGSIPDVAKVKGNAGFTARADDLFVISLSGNWVGTRQSPRTDPYGPVKGYVLTNISLSTVPLFKNKITASITIHNLFNTKWLDPGFRTADGLVYSTVLEQPGINGVFKIGCDAIKMSELGFLRLIGFIEIWFFSLKHLFVVKIMTNIKSAIRQQFLLPTKNYKLSFNYMPKRILFLILLLSFSRMATAQIQEREANLEAAFIYNFTKYIEWDSVNNNNEFVIGIIGPSPVTAILNEIAATNKVDNKKIIVRQFNKPEEITPCEILFIPQKLPFPLHSILNRVGKGVLTISEEEGYAKQGTAFNFIVRNDKLKFESNINVINAAGLKAGSQLLKLAVLVD